MSLIVSRFTNGVLVRNTEYELPTRTTRWRKDPDGVMKCRAASELRPGNDLRPEIERGSWVKYANECPGEGWVEAGYIEDGVLHLPPEETKETRESLIEGRITHR